MICPSCKKEISEDAKFCPNCLIPIKVGKVILPSSDNTKEKIMVTKIEQKAEVSNNKNNLKNTPFSKRGEPELFIASNNKKKYLIIGGIVVLIILLVLIGFGIYNLVKSTDKKPVDDYDIVDESKLPLFKKVMGNWVYEESGMTYLLTDKGKYTYYKDLEKKDTCEGKYDIKSGAITAEGNNIVIDKDSNFIYTIILKPRSCTISGEVVTTDLKKEEYAFTVILPSREKAIIRNIKDNKEQVLVNK